MVRLKTVFRQSNGSVDFSERSRLLEWNADPFDLDKANLPNIRAHMRADLGYFIEGVMAEQLLHVKEYPAVDE